MGIFDQYEVQEAPPDEDDRPAIGSRWVDRQTGNEYTWTGECYESSVNAMVINWDIAGSYDLVDYERWKLIDKEAAQMRLSELADLAHNAGFSDEWSMGVLKGLGADVEPFNTEFGTYLAPVNITRDQLARYETKVRAAIANRELGFEEPEQHTGEIVPQLPQLVDSDGEVINREWVDQHLGRDDFAIDSEASADWFITRVRELQDRCERVAEMASAAITESLRHMAGMMFYYGPQLREYAVAQLPIAKTGKYRSKNVKYSQGAVFFRKVGGWQVVDRQALQAFVDSLQGREAMYQNMLEKLANADSGVIPEQIQDEIRTLLATKTQLEQFPVRIERKVDSRKMLKLCEATGKAYPGCFKKEDDELAVMQIGGKRAWSVARVKEHLKGLKLDQYKALAYEEEATDVEEVE